MVAAAAPLVVVVGVVVEGGEEEEKHAKAVNISTSALFASGKLAPRKHIKMHKVNVIAPKTINYKKLL